MKLELMHSVKSIEPLENIGSGTTGIKFLCHIRDSIHQADGRFIATSREVANPLDWMLQRSHHSEIWQPSGQLRCRGACQTSEQLEKFKPESRDSETSRDLYDKTSVRLVNE